MKIRKLSNRLQSGCLAVAVEIGWVFGTIPQLAHPCGGTYRLRWLTIRLAA